MLALGWIVVAILAAVIYYLINKYDKHVSMLNKLIELNRAQIEANQVNIAENASKISTNKSNITKYMKQSQGFSPYFKVLFI